MGKKSRRQREKDGATRTYRNDDQGLKMRVPVFSTIEEAEANFRDATPPCRPGELVDMRIYPEFCAAVLALSEVVVTDEDDKENFNEYMKHKSSFITGRPDVVLKTIKRWPRIRKYWPRIRRRICWCCTREYDLSEPRLWVCGGCGDARYCDEACQAADWPDHRGYCIAKIRRELHKGLSEGKTQDEICHELVHATSSSHK